MKQDYIFGTKKRQGSRSVIFSDNGYADLSYEDLTYERFLLYSFIVGKS